MGKIISDKNITILLCVTIKETSHNYLFSLIHSIDRALFMRKRDLQFQGEPFVAEELPPVGKTYIKHIQLGNLCA